jgi:hypothetical protein
VHLGAAEGRVAYFSVAYPWSVAAVEARPAPPQPTSPLEYAAGAFIALVILGICRLVWKNLSSSRGDRAGAFRIALAVFAFACINIVVVQHRLPAPRSIIAGGSVLGLAAFSALEFWFFYIALEPLSRRVYPQALVSWTRVLRGQFSDPLVGRHILYGLLIAPSASCAPRSSRPRTTLSFAPARRWRSTGARAGTWAAPPS